MEQIARVNGIYQATLLDLVKVALVSTPPSHPELQLQAMAPLLLQPLMMRVASVAEVLLVH